MMFNKNNGNWKEQRQLLSSFRVFIILTMQKRNENRGCHARTQLSGARKRRPLIKTGGCDVYINKDTIKY